MKSQELLNSFVAYCHKYPDLRFWQALVSWSKYAFIYVSKEPVLHEKLIDTYYYNNQIELEDEKF